MLDKKVKIVVVRSEQEMCNYECYETPEKAFQAIECLCSKLSSIKYLTARETEETVFIEVVANGLWNPVLFTEKRYNKYITDLGALRKKIVSKTDSKIMCDSLIGYIKWIGKSYSRAALKESTEKTFESRLASLYLNN